MLICDHPFCLIIGMSPGIVLVMPRHRLGHKSAPGIVPSQLDVQGHLVLEAVGGEGKVLSCRSTAVLCPFFQGTRTACPLSYLSARARAWRLHRPPGKYLAFYTATVDSFRSVSELLLTTLDFFLWLQIIFPNYLQIVLVILKKTAFKIQNLQI